MSGIVHDPRRFVSFPGNARPRRQGDRETYPGTGDRAPFCPLTALCFHELKTQLPPDVWIALPESARKPRLDNPRLQVVRFSGPALHEGIETHRVEGAFTMGALDRAARACRVYRVIGPYVEAVVS